MNQKERELTQLGTYAEELMKSKAYSVLFDRIESDMGREMLAADTPEKREAVKHAHTGMMTFVKRIKQFVAQKDNIQLMDERKQADIAAFGDVDDKYLGD